MKEEESVLINTLMAKLDARLSVTHPDMDDEMKDAVVDLLCSEVLLKQGIDDPAEISDADWGNLIEGACYELEEDSFDLRMVSENQLACEGYDLVYMLNFDDGTGIALYDRLNLTYVMGDPIDGETVYDFPDLDEEEPYMITWPDGCDTFEIAQAVAIEKMDRARFDALADDVEDVEDPCDGGCCCCDQTCAGKDDWQA